MRRLLAALALVAWPAVAGATTRGEVLHRASLAVGYSYWPGHARFRPDGVDRGTCSGTCPNCAHTGHNGVDSGGLVQKAFMVPEPTPLHVDPPVHMTSASFVEPSALFAEIDRGALRPGDALVLAEGGRGHALIYERDDPWGWARAYECKRCGEGCVHGARMVPAAYRAVRLASIVEGADDDGDGVIDEVDVCIGVHDPAQLDGDGDGVGDACDDDDDGDGVPDEADLCPLVADAAQADGDQDGVGDACDDDDDGDGVPDANDRCPAAPDPGQRDGDGDGKGDACDDDDDGDGVPDGSDVCPLVGDPDQRDGDGDGKGDACEDDGDGDGLPDQIDLCPAAPDPGQEDRDGDGLGDACDDDRDGDGVPDELDRCPDVADPSQQDRDNDGKGDACDDDDDSDGVPDGRDNCRLDVNPRQRDLDGDGVGDICDDDHDGDGVTDARDRCFGSLDQPGASPCPSGDLGLDDPLVARAEGITQKPPVVGALPRDSGFACSLAAPRGQSALPLLVVALAARRRRRAPS